MLAYHNDAALKKSVVAQMKNHRLADELIKGRYWENGKGCAVGCLIKGNNHALYETKFGIPQSLARLEDTIFENLENGASQKWPERFLNAIKPGADLATVQWKFLHWLQKENLKNARKEKMPSDIISAIKQCVDVLAPMTKGNSVDEKAAESAAWSAWSAESAAWSAESAAWSAESAESAAWSAESAAWSAWSAESAAWSAAWSAESATNAQQKAWVKMADKLIEFLQAAK